MDTGSRFAPSWSVSPVVPQQALVATLLQTSPSCSMLMRRFVLASHSLSPIVVVVSSNIVGPGWQARVELDPPSVSVSEQVLRVYGYVPLASSALILYILLTDLGLDILA